MWNILETRTDCPGRGDELAFRHEFDQHLSTRAPALPLAAGMYAARSVLHANSFPAEHVTTMNAV